MKRFYEYYIYKHGYASNVIEHKNLTLDKYKEYIIENKEYSNYEIEQMFKHAAPENLLNFVLRKEVVNFNNTVENLIAHQFYRDEEISETMIKELSKSLLQGFDKAPWNEAINGLQFVIDKKTQKINNQNIVGEYRSSNTSKELSKGLEIFFPRSAYIPELINESLDQYKKVIDNSNSTILDKFKAIWLFHLNFELIHPFIEGNGRVGRFISDIMHVQNKLVPVSFSGESKLEYNEIIKETLSPLQINRNKSKLLNKLPAKFESYIFTEFVKEYKEFTDLNEDFDFNNLFENSVKLNDEIENKK